MELKVTLNVNPKQTIEAKFEGANIQEAVLAAGCILDFEGECGFCKEENISLRTRVTKDKGFKYTEFVCKACGARRQMGEYRDGSGFFLKPWQGAYKGDEQKEG